MLIVFCRIHNRNEYPFIVNSTFFLFDTGFAKPFASRNFHFGISRLSGEKSHIFIQYIEQHIPGRNREKHVGFSNGNEVKKI